MNKRNYEDSTTDRVRIVVSELESISAYLIKIVPPDFQVFSKIQDAHDQVQAGINKLKEINHD